MELQLLQYDKNFSKKPILQLQVIEDYNLLFSLSDSQLSINDISRHNFPLIHLATRTKGANTFSMDVQKTQSLTDQTHFVVRVCVAVKRKLQFYYWKRNELLEFAPDIELTDVPKVVAWTGNQICIGYKTEYVLYDISDADKRKKQDLFPTTSNSRSIDPCVALIDNDRFFAVVKDEHLITIPTNDEAKNNPSKLDSEASILIPQSNKASPITITWSEPPILVVWDRPYLLGLMTDSVEVRVLDTSGLDKDNLIQTIPDLQKARFLINGRNNQQGLIFAASTTHLWCIESIDIATQRQNLLQDKKWFLALQLTQMSDESEEEKQSITYEIQTLYAYDLFINKQFREAMLEFSKLKTDPTNVIKLFPDLLPTACEPQSNVSRSMSSSMVESELMRELPKLADKDLENGLLALIDYLVEIRSQVGKLQGNAKSFGRNPKVLLSIIDTTLLKCYLETNDSFVSSLIRLNNCHLEESEKILKSCKKFGELIILYQTKGQHKRALTLLKTSPNFEYERTIQYLQHLGAEHKKIIFEFADWVIQEHPQEGLKIFTEDIQEIENLPRADVLDFLLKSHKTLVVPYLEHIINTWNEVKPIFHNILIQQYKEQIFCLQSEPLESVHQKKIQLQDIREKLVNFLKSSNKYAADKVLVDFPYNDLFEERAIVLGKLSKHEKVIAIYIQILGDVDKAILYCDQVYATAGIRHHEVYIILIRLLLNPPSVPPYSDVELHTRCLQPDIETVLDVLEKNAKKINPHSALAVSSDTR